MLKKDGPILILLAVSLLVGAFTFDQYGESWDELSLQKYAAKSLYAYTAWGQEGVVDITWDDLGTYGPFYVMTVEKVTRFLAPGISIRPPDARHLLYFLTFLTGVWAFYALCIRWLARLPALGATLLFMTQPLLWGHAFINPKDTPFLALFLLSLHFGFKLADSFKPLSFESLIAPARRALTIITALWLLSVFSLFLFTDMFLTLISNLVLGAQAGEMNIVSLVASNIHSAPPEVYIQRYSNLFLRTRAVYFVLSTIVLLYAYFRLMQTLIKLIIAVLPAAILLGFTTSTRIIGPFAGLLVCYYLLRVKGRDAVPAIAMYALIAMISMYATWPYLWPDPIGRFTDSLRTMSLYPWQGGVVFNGREYESSNLPFSYLPVLFSIQLTEPVWVLAFAGWVTAISSWVRKRVLVELSILWFLIPASALIMFRAALYDNFRQVFFILPPVFLMTGLAFEKISRAHWQAVVITLCLIPGFAGILSLQPYEYTYYNRFIGGLDGAKDRFELDYWAISYREAADYINAHASPNAAIWVEGPAHMVGLYAREDLKIYSWQLEERADQYEYVIATTRYGLDKQSFTDAAIVHRIARRSALFTVIKKP